MNINRTHSPFSWIGESLSDTSSITDSPPHTSSTEAVIPAGAQAPELELVKTGSFVDSAYDSTLFAMFLPKASSPDTREKVSDSSSFLEEESSGFPAGIATTEVEDLDELKQRVELIIRLQTEELKALKELEDLDEMGQRAGLEELTQMGEMDEQWGGTGSSTNHFALDERYLHTPAQSTMLERSESSSRGSRKRVRHNQGESEAARIYHPRKRRRITKTREEGFSDQQIIAPSNEEKRIAAHQKMKDMMYLRTMAPLTRRQQGVYRSLTIEQRSYCQQIVQMLRNDPLYYLNIPLKELTLRSGLSADVAQIACQQAKINY